MAERRMFAKTIIDSDAFLDMPLSTQALYFHLNMRADDEGFVNNPKKIARMVGCGEDDLKLLAAKSFIIPFESGVVVIKHWKIHNYIRGDRLQETKYSDERALLDVKENGAYTINGDVSHLTVTCQSLDSHLSDTCQSLDSHLSDTCPSNVRIGKDRIGKYSIDNNKDILSGKCSEIITYLNEICHTSFKSSTSKTRTLIHARLEEGFTVDDFKTVIDTKSEQWLGDTKMSQYLRPETLFGTKFEAYLNERKKYDRGHNKGYAEDAKRMYGDPNDDSSDLTFGDM